MVSIVVKAVKAVKAVAAVSIVAKVAVVVSDQVKVVRAVAAVSVRAKVAVAVKAGPVVPVQVAVTTRVDLAKATEKPPHAKTFKRNILS